MNDQCAASLRYHHFERLVLVRINFSFLREEGETTGADPVCAVPGRGPLGENEEDMTDWRDYLAGEDDFVAELALVADR